MQETQAIAKNTIIQVIGKIISTIFGVLTIAILARLLGPVGYGQLTLALGFLAIFATLVDFGLTLTTTQMISEFHHRQRQILSALVSLRAISALIFLSLAPIVALFFPYDSVVVIAIAIGSVSFFAASGAQVMQGVFQKNLDMLKPLLAEVFNRSTVLFGALALTLFPPNLLYVMWLFVLGNTIQLIYILLSAYKYINFKPTIDLQIWREIISRSWPIGASIFFNLIYLKGDIVFLSLYRDEIEIGLYGISYKIIEVLASIPVMYMGLILPILVASWSKNNKDKFNKMIQQAFDFFAITSLPIAFGSAILGTAIITFVVGPEFAPAGPVLYLLGPTLIFVFFGALYKHSIVGIGKQKPMTWGYLAVAIITVIGYLIHIPQYGMYGAAFWTLVSEALIALLTFIVVVRTTQYIPKLKTLSIALLSSIAMSIVIITLPNNMHIILTVTLGALTYIITLAALGGPTYKDLWRLFSADKLPIVQG